MRCRNNRPNLGSKGGTAAIRKRSSPSRFSEEAAAHAVYVGTHSATSAAAARARSVEWLECLALFLSPGKQDDDDAERCHNRGGGEACGRDFGAGMKTFL
jgi:hypothetical protein